MMTRKALLAELGVVQYERRQPASEDATSEISNVSEDVEPLLSVRKHKQPQQVAGPEFAAVERSENAGSSKVERQELVEELASTLEDLNSSVPDVLDEHPAEAANEATVDGESNRAFELLFWRSGSLLILESSSGEDELTDTKHRLANNILRTLVPSRSGVVMRNTSWPMQGVPASDTDAEQWLRVFLKGQLSQDPETKVWMMGVDLIELVLSKHGTASELTGLRLLDNQTGMELFVTDSLGEMIRKPFLKATTWKALKSLSA